MLFILSQNKLCKALRKLVFILSSNVFIFIFMYLSLSPSIGSLSNFTSSKSLTYFHISVYVFNSLLSIALKYIVLLLSKHLTWSFIRSGLIASSSSSSSSSSLYPMKYLIDLSVPYGSYFETNSSSPSISSILNNFLLL